MQPSAKRKPRAKNNKRRRLPNGFGQISEIKNRNLRNPFRAMVTVGKTQDGKPICKPLKPESYFATYNDAYAALVEYNKNPYDLGAAITVRELYEKWSEEYFKTLKAEGSIRSVESAWRYCSAVYDMRVMDVRARHVKGCMDEGTALIRGVERHPSASMKNQIKSLFNLMLDYALEYELVDRNYARTFNLTEDTIKEIHTVKKGHIPFSDEEISALWEHVEDKNFVDVMLIQCYSGWRPQELGLIELANVDLENGTFKGGMKTEAGTDRVVPIHPKIRRLVERRYEQARRLGSPYLFNCKDGRSGKPVPMTYQRYQHGFSMVRDELKLNPEHRPHDGRKHFVTAAKNAGVDEYAIKYMVGHKISDITEKVYTQREFEWLRTEIEKIK
jgi:integrase